MSGRKFDETKVKRDAYGRFAPKGYKDALEVRDKKLIVRPDLAARELAVKAALFGLDVPHRIIERPEGGWLQAIEEAGALEEIPFDEIDLIKSAPLQEIEISLDDETIATLYDGEPVEAVDAVCEAITEMQSEVPQGWRISWTKMAAASLIPVAIAAGQYLYSNGTPQSRIQQASALKTSNAHHAIVQQHAPQAVKPFNKATAPAKKPAAAAPAMMPHEEIPVAPAEKPIPELKATILPPTLSGTDVQLTAPASEKKSVVSKAFSDNSGCEEYKTPEQKDALLKEVAGDYYAAVHCIIASESGFDNVTSHSGAVGIGQWTEGPFLEQLVKSKKHMPEYAHRIADNIQARHTKNRTFYEGKGKTPAEKAANRAAALALRTHERVALIATADYVRDLAKDAKKLYKHRVQETIDRLERMPRSAALKNRILELKDQKNRPWTVADVKILYFAGLNGGVKLLAAHADPVTREQSASNHTAAVVVRNNRSVFADRHGRRSVGEVVEYMEDRVGNNLLPEDDEDNTLMASANPGINPESALR